VERSLDIEVTRRCNLRCDYCFVGWSRSWTDSLPPDLVREIVREGVGRFDLLHLTGGEPFTWPALLDIVEEGLALGYPRALINTNATVLTDAHVARLATFGGRVALSVSLDGPPSMHDPIRGEGNFAKADRRIADLLDAGVPVTLMTVVTPAVLDVLPTFLAERFAAHPRLTGVTLFPVGVGPEGTQKPGKAMRPLTPAELHRLAAVTVLATHLGRDVRVAAYPLITPILTRLGYPRERLYQCAAGRGRVAVHADRGVSTCHPVKEPVYGTWAPGLFEQIPAMDAHRRMATRDFDGCRSCPLKEGCGHCRAFVTGVGRPLYGNDEVCLEAVPGRRADLAQAQRAAVEVVRALVEALQVDDVSRVAALLTEDVVDAQPTWLQPPGSAGVAWKMALFKATHPRFVTTLLDVVPSPEGATARWLTRLEPDQAPLLFHGTFTVRGDRIAALSVEPLGAQEVARVA
jgi:MoaA/NifB/PqqE/SkfB family radical SAM enzyme